MEKSFMQLQNGVSEIDIMDFLRCDGFCILRQGNPLLAETACDYVKWVLRFKGQYDFDFKSANNRWYCHELGAMAYESMHLQKKPSKILGITFAPRYLDSTFLDDSRFTKILEV